MIRVAAVVRCDGVAGASCGSEARVTAVWPHAVDVVAVPRRYPGPALVGLPAGWVVAGEDVVCPRCYAAAAKGTLQ